MSLLILEKMKLNSKSCFLIQVYLSLYITAGKMKIRMCPKLKTSWNFDIWWKQAWN